MIQSRQLISFSPALTAERHPAQFQQREDGEDENHNGYDKVNHLADGGGEAG